MMRPLTSRVWLLLICGVTAGACDCNDDLAPLSDAALHADARFNDGSTDATADDDSGRLDAASDTGISDASAHDATTGDANVFGGCRSAACDLIDNGCDTDQACYFLPAAAQHASEPRCVAAGDNAAGTICTTQEQCAPGLGCDPGHRCRNYCCDPGQQSGCPDGQACLIEFRDNDDAPLGVGLCQACVDCDPVSGSGCDVDQACYPASDDGACRLCLTPRDSGNIGAACSTSSDCRSGLGCIAREPSVCMRLCSVSDDTTCTNTQRCTAIGYTGLPDLGFCDAL